MSFAENRALGLLVSAWSSASNPPRARSVAMVAGAGPIGNSQ